jgi:phosphatidylinositol glycan class Q protein
VHAIDCYLIGWYISDYQFCISDVVKEFTVQKNGPQIIGKIATKVDAIAESSYILLSSKLFLEKMQVNGIEVDLEDISQIHVILYNGTVKDVDDEVIHGEETRKTVTCLKKATTKRERRRISMAKARGALYNLLVAIVSWIIQLIEYFEVPSLVVWFIQRRRGGETIGSLPAAAPKPSATSAIPIANVQATSAPKMYTYSATLRQVHYRLTQLLHLHLNKAVLVNWAIDFTIGALLGYFLYTQHQDRQIFSIILRYVKDFYVRNTQLMKSHVKNLLTSRPAGIKLNTQLAAMLGQMALAGIEWWTDVLSIMEFMGKYLLIAVAVIGSFGISFALSLVYDLVSILSSQLVLFYLMSARVYSMELGAILSLFRLFRGKKRNVLRNRIDSCDYSMEQIVLGTFMFTLLCFLFPTIASYYLSFAMVSVLVAAAHVCIQTIITLLNDLPIWNLLVHVLSRGEINGLWFDVKSHSYEQGQTLIVSHLNYNRKGFLTVFDPLRHSFEKMFDQYRPTRLVKAIAMGEPI